MAMLLAGELRAQESTTGSALRFGSLVADYGHIREDGGAVACRYEAINEGEQPIVVTEVITSCGCTTAKYERKPIPPGGRFTLELRYDPMNRPGRIDRTIYVGVSDLSDHIKLRMVGYVTPRERSIEELYPFDMGGGLRLQSNFHAFAYVEHGKSVECRIGYANNSDRPIEIYFSPVRSSGALRIEYTDRIEPHTTGDITLCYSLAEHSSRYGTLDDKLKVVVNGKASETLLTTYAIAVDNFDNVDDISAPRGSISKNIIKFGEVNSEELYLEEWFELRNEGGSPLVVRTVECSNDALRCSIARNTTIAPGATQRFTVKLRPALMGSDTPYVGRVTLITNDPIRPMQVVRVNAIAK